MFKSIIRELVEIIKHDHFLKVIIFTRCDHYKTGATSAKGFAFHFFIGQTKEETHICQMLVDN